MHGWVFDVLEVLNAAYALRDERFLTILVFVDDLKKHIAQFAELKAELLIRLLVQACERTILVGNDCSCPSAAVNKTDLAEEVGLC